MLRKAGIAAAAAAAGLLAVSPLAFASDDDQHGHIDINHITRQAPVRVCGTHSGGSGSYAGYGAKVENKQVNSGHCEQSSSSSN